MIVNVLILLFSVIDGKRTESRTTGKSTTIGSHSNREEEHWSLLLPETKTLVSFKSNAFQNFRLTIGFLLNDNVMLPGEIFDYRQIEGKDRSNPFGAFWRDIPGHG